MLPSDRSLLKRALALLTLSFRPVTADIIYFTSGQAQNREVRHARNTFLPFIMPPEKGHK